jgi:hypothetical protein
VRIHLFALAAGVVLDFTLASLRADEQKVAPDRLPEPVVNAIKSKYRGAEILSAEMERENGRTQYEVAVKHNNRTMKVTLTEKGAIVSTATEIAAAQLPQPVVEAIMTRYRGANPARIQEIEENGKTSYAFQFPADRERMTVHFDPTGRPIERPPISSADHCMTFQIGDQVICRADFSADRDGSHLVRLTSLNQEIRPVGAASLDQAGTTRVFGQLLYSARAAGESGLIPFNESDVLAMTRLLNPALSPQLDVWGNGTRQAAVGILLWQADRARQSGWQAAWYDLAGKDLALRNQFGKELIGIGKEALRPSAKPRDEKKE